MFEGGDALEETTPTPDSGTDAPKDSPSTQDVVTQDVVTQDVVTKDVVTQDVVTQDVVTKDASDGCSGAVAQFSTSTINEGAGNCGDSAGVTHSFSIQNTGCSNLTVSASVSGTVFSASPTMLTVAPGMTGTITVKAVVPASSTAGTALSGSMALTTNDPAHATATIPLSVTPTGATLAWASSSPTTANFGVQPINQAAAPIGLTLQNSGNAAATVAFGTPSNAQFSLSPTSGSIAAGGTTALSAGFTPNTTTATTATSAFTVTGAVCGMSVSSVSFSGQGGTGSVTGWPTGTEDFGGGACGGGAPASQSFTLNNAGSVAAHITAITFAGYAGYGTSATVGATIPAMGSLPVTITAPAIPFPSAVPGNFAGSVTFTTDVAGDTPHQINLTEHAVGAVLAWDTSATPNFGSFGNVPAGTNANQNFAVTNTGNATSTVTLATNTPFSVLPAVAINITGGSSQNETATFSPQTFGPFGSQLVMSGTALCEPVPQPLSLQGTGVAGGIAISTQSLSFSVACGKTAPSQQFTITNPANATASMTWNASLGLGANSPYTFSPNTGTLSPGQSSTVTVSPNAMPQYPANTKPSAFADSITITTDIPNDTAHTVSLSETPLGDILSVTPTSMNFGQVSINTSSSPQTFVVANAGNGLAPGDTGNVSIASSNATAFSLSTSSVTAPAGGQSGNVSVTFNAPGSPGSYSSNIDINTTDVLCAPLPTSPAIAASGIATEAGPVIQPPALGFGDVNCGATASAQQITASNPCPGGNCSTVQAYTITGLTLGKGANSYFSVAMVPASGVVNPGGQVVITVTPSAIPTTHSPVPDTPNFSDKLTIATNANVPNPNTDVPLVMGAQGVIIDNILASTNWAFGTVNYGSTGLYNVAIHNSGNQQAQATLTGLNYPTIFGLQGNPATVNIGQGTTLTGTFSPPSPNGTWADTGTLTITPVTGAVLCEPLPTSWQTPTLTFTGSAVPSDISVSPNPLAFPAATCTGALPAAKNVTVSNNGNNPQNYSATLSSTGTTTGTYYTITAGASGSVPGMSAVAITITPTVNLAQGAGAPVGSAAYDDNLDINIANTLFQIPITMTVNGVVLNFVNPLGLSYAGWNDGAGDCSVFTYDYYYDDFFGGIRFWNPQISNSGTIAGTVSASFSGWSANDFISTPTAANVNSGALQTFGLTVNTATAPQATQCAGYSYSWFQGTETFNSTNMCNSAISSTIAGFYAP
jgi:hypothetical protein